MLRCKKKDISQNERRFGKNVSGLIKFRRWPQTAGLPDTVVVLCVVTKTRKDGNKYGKETRERRGKYP